MCASIPPAWPGFESGLRAGGARARAARFACARRAILRLPLLLMLVAAAAQAASRDGAVPSVDEPGAEAGAAAPSADPARSTPGAVRAEAIAVEDERLRPAEVYQDTPVETEILDAEKLRNLPAINAIEALEAIPGIRITGQVQGQRGAVRIDGLPAEFTEILVNGQRYAGENEEAIDLGDVLFANVERIEILRGPQALRHSSRAAGGVIHIITRDPPRDGPAAEAMIATGDQEQVSGELTTGFGNETLGGSLVYDYNQIGGFESPDPESTDFDDGLASPFGEGSLYRTHDLYATLAADPHDSVSAKTRLGYRIRDEGFAVDDGPISSRRENQRALFSQQLEFAVGSASSLAATLTQSSDWTETDVGRRFRLADGFTRLELRGEHVLELGPTTHVASLGTDLATFAIELEEGPVDEDIDVEPGELSERIYRGGFYGIVESEWTDWLASEIGIRREVHSRFFPAWLPQAAILVTPVRWGEDRALKLRLSAGRAVRYPSLRDVFQPPAPQQGGAYFLAGSRDLEPEKAWALRASVEAAPARWLSTTVTGFYSATSNSIRAAYRDRDIQVRETVIPANPALCPILPIWCTDRVEAVTSPVFENANLDDFLSYGVETRIEFRPATWLELQLGYTWNRSLVDDSNLALENDLLPNSPEHIANGVVTLTAPRWQTALTLRGQWRDRAVIERSGTGLSSFATGQESNTSIEFDLRLRQPLDLWLERPLEVFADLQNATDNRVIDSNVVRGRSFLIGLRGRFP